jgi:ABC-type Fe3+ transport system permease subunit
MGRRARVVVYVSLAAAVLVFAFVQDRVVTSGAIRYAVLQRQAISGQGTGVTIDEVMRPAVDRSVTQALGWAAIVIVAGFGAAAVISRKRA